MTRSTKAKHAEGRADPSRAPASAFDWRGQSTVGAELHHRARLSAGSARANQEALDRGVIRARLDFTPKS